MMEATVRDVTGADVSAVKQVADACFTDPWSESTFRAQLSSAVFKVADLNGSVIGFAVAVAIGDEAELYDIAVLPEERGTGIAARLLAAVKTETKACGAQKLYLEVREGNSRARAFYAKSGFETDGVRKNYYKNPTENAILMSLDLNG